MSRFEEELRNLINCNSIENESNTPDWVLAQYLIGCLAAWKTATKQRDNWYGQDPKPFHKLSKTEHKAVQPFPEN